MPAASCAKGQKQAGTARDATRGRVSPRQTPRESRLSYELQLDVSRRQRRRHDDHDEDRPSKAELVVHSQPLAFGAEVVRSSSTSVYIDHISPTTCVNHVVCWQRRNRKVARAVPDSSVLHIHTQINSWCLVLILGKEFKGLVDRERAVSPILEKKK